MAHLYNIEDRKKSVFIASDGKHLGTWKSGGEVGSLSGVTAAQSPLRDYRKGACLVIENWKRPSLQIHEAGRIHH